MTALCCPLAYSLSWSPMRLWGGRVFCLWPEFMLSVSSHYFLQAKAVTGPSLLSFPPRGVLQPPTLRRRQDSGQAAFRSARDLEDILKDTHISVPDCGLNYSALGHLLINYETKPPREQKWQCCILPCASCLSWSKDFTFLQTGDELAVVARYPDITIQQFVPVIIHVEDKEKNPLQKQRKKVKNIHWWPVGDYF